MSAAKAGRVTKPRRTRGAKQKAVLRMMAIMTDGQSSETVPREFLETGRTGRRNAMPDILQAQNAEASTADLPQRLQQLATTDPVNPQPGTSKDLTPTQPDDAQAKTSCS